MSLNRSPNAGIVARSFISGSRFGAAVEKALYAAELCSDVHFRLRRRDHLPVSLGRPVQAAGLVRAAGDVDLSRHPDRGIHLDLEEGRAGVGVGFCRAAPGGAWSSLPS